jgi:hypothetical protein
MRVARRILSSMALAFLILFSIALQPAAEQPQEYEKLSPFEAVRWGQGAVEVDLGGIQYELLEIQDLPLEKVLEYCKKNHGPEWRKAFEENLVEVLVKLEKPAEYTVKVKMRRLDDGSERVFEQAMLTESNLEMVIKARPAAPPAPEAAPEEPQAGPAKRIEREHAGKVAEPYQFLAERIEPRSARGKIVLARKQAEEDLDELEWHLVHRYAYLAHKGVDYRAALDTIRTALGEGIPHAAFAMQVHELLALFGDGHTNSSMDFNAELSAQFLPFAVAEIGGGRLVAFDTEFGGFVDLDHPVLSKLDGVEASKWVEAAKRAAPGGSPQSVRRHAVDALKYVHYVRARLGLDPTPQIAVELTSADGTKGRTVGVRLADAPVKPPWPREAPGRTLEGNVGYVRIATMTDDPRFLRNLHDTMAAVRGTVGLVVDVRNNGGGSREVLREFFPYFMKPGEAPRVVNVAAYRLAEGEASDEKEGYLQDRSLYPLTSGAWQPAERAALEEFAKSFKPEWAPPAGQFSAWHYMVLSPRDGGPYYHYDKPVIVLTNAGCFSATDVFLGAFKGRPNVTLMGTPSAGSSGRARTLRLANSGITVRLSSIASFQPDGKLYDGRGVEPDVEAWPEPTDVIGRTDTVLDAAVKRLQAK